MATAILSGERRNLQGNVACALGAIAAGVVGGLIIWGDEPLPELVFSFPAGAAGPLDEGESYDLSVLGGDDATLYRLIVDGEPIGQPSSQVDPVIARAGRHSLAVEVTRGDVIESTEVVETYTIGALPPAGLRVNLASVTADPSKWSSAISQFDRLVDDGHVELELLPSDWFASLTPGYWNIFVPGFGEDRAEANAYCASFSLVSTDECFVSHFDPNA